MTDHEALSRSMQGEQITISTVEINSVPGFGAKWVDKICEKCNPVIPRGVGASPQEAIDKLMTETERLAGGG